MQRKAIFARCMCEQRNGDQEKFRRSGEREGGRRLIQALNLITLVHRGAKTRQNRLMQKNLSF